MIQRLQRHVETLLNGKICKSISVDGGISMFDFGDSSLTISCSWRLIKGNLETLSETDLAKGNTDFSYIVGKRVIAAEIKGQRNDLEIHFDDRFRLYIESDSDVYENWVLMRSAEDMIVAGPGDAIGEWESG